MRTLGVAPRRCQAILLAVVGSLLAGCQGNLSSKPPIHLNPNMDNMAHVRAQAPNEFFEDGRGMRPRVEGTVPRGSLHDDDHLYRGRLPDGSWAETLPTDLKPGTALLLRGKERYDIYCTPCHDSAGTGRGTVVERGMASPPSFHDDRLRAMPLGQLLDIVGNGIRNMPGYASQVTVDDRWAIAAYVRTLQVAHDRAIEDVPAGIAGSKGWGAQ